MTEKPRYFSDDGVPLRKLSKPYQWAPRPTQTPAWVSDPKLQRAFASVVKLNATSKCGIGHTLIKVSDGHGVHLSQLSWLWNQAHGDRKMTMPTQTDFNFEDERKAVRRLIHPVG